mmetsp:Transcript_22345/g.29233  ORF Transcript_22345/g.29233 Transcript_22345/m.29233 type:complete len:379 (+) Transcript_22345:58-1194(+)
MEKNRNPIPNAPTPAMHSASIPPQHNPSSKGQPYIPNLQGPQKDQNQVNKYTASSMKMSSSFPASLPPNNSNEIRNTEGEDFMQLFQEAGLGGIAKDVGMVQDKTMKPLSESSINKRGNPDPLSNIQPSKRSKNGERGTVLGLRDFSLMVCQKVKAKGHTTHTCVADELVQEMLYPTDGRKAVQYDEKNIRRRVYDALNVLMAMGIIAKDKKELRWKGLPSNPFNEIELLARKKQELKVTIEKKREQLQELLLQQIAFKNLIHRNIRKEAEERKRGEQKSPDIHTKIPLPFIVISTSSNTIIQCEMSEDRSDVFFNFSAAFEIKDDNEILKRLQMHKAPSEMLPHLIPNHLIPYLSPDSSKSSSVEPPTGGNENGFKR